MVVSLYHLLEPILNERTNRTRGARGGLKLPRTLRLRGDANQYASDTLADSRVQNPKIFLTFLLFLGGGCGGSRQKMERKFLVLLRRFRLQNEHLYYSICGSLELFFFPSSRRDEALPLDV